MNKGGIMKKKTQKLIVWLLLLIMTGGILASFIVYLI